MTIRRRGKISPALEAARIVEFGYRPVLFSVDG
jgi:hypothetical protein